VTAGDVGSLASAVAAFSALVVSIISLRKTNRFGETTDRLNRILIQRENAESAATKKADLSANFYEKGKSDYQLKVFNRGKGRALNVRLIDLNCENSSILIAAEIYEKFPLPILEQHQSIELCAVVSLGSDGRAHIKLIWDDETGKDYEKELTPSL